MRVKKEISDPCIKNTDDRESRIKQRKEGVL